MRSENVSSVQSARVENQLVQSKTISNIQFQQQ